MLTKLYPYRKALLLINVLIVLIALPGIKRALQPANEVSIWFKPGDPALIKYQEFNETFGNDRVIIACTCDEEGIFTQTVIDEIQAATSNLQEIEGVNRVSSFLNGKDVIKVREESRTTVRYTSYFREPQFEAFEKLDSLKQGLLQSETMLQRFINADATCYNLLITLMAFDEVDSRRESILQEIEATISHNIKTGNTYLGGLDVVTNGLNQITKEQFVLFLFLSYVFLILLIAVLFRRLYYVLYSFLSTLFSLLITLGWYGYAGFSLNIFTVIIPPLIIVLGVILIVHILDTLEEDTGGLLGRIDEVFRPCLFASLTTIIGLISLASSPTQMLWSFGLFSALGVAVMFIQAFVFALLLLSFLRNKTRSGSAVFNWGRIMQAWAGRLYKIRIWLVAGLVVVLLLAVRGFFLMKVDMWPLTYFPQDHPVYSDHKAIEENWGHYLPLDLVLEVDSTHSLYNPVLLAGLEAFFDELETVDALSTSISYHHLIKRTSVLLFNQELRDILFNPMLSRPFLGSLERMDLEANDYLRPDINRARIVLIGPSLTTLELAQVASFVEATAADKLPNFATISVSGYPVLFVQIMDHAINSMRNSLVLALILIFFLMLLLFRSFVKAVVALVPNVFTILLLFAFMGYAGINLDLATVTLAAIILGVSIDDTIHFVYFFEKHTDRRLPAWERVILAFEHKGKIILMTSIVLMLGFSTMLFAGLKTVFYFGLLMVFSGFAAIIGDLVLLPFLLRFTRRMKESPEKPNG